MEHSITGNINFEFNNSVIEGMLGPAVLRALQSGLAKPMIQEAIARQLKGLVHGRALK
jgi:hypothetical protein